MAMKQSTEYAVQSARYTKRRPSAALAGLGVLALGALVVAAGIYFTPDFVRYMKMEAM